MEEKISTLQVTNQRGDVFDIEVIDIISLDEFNKDYIIYTLGEIDKNNNQKIYASILEEKENTYALKTLENEKEWKLIQDKIRAMFE